MNFSISAYSEIEEAFEHGLKHDLNIGVDFDSDPQYFLGLKIEFSRDADNHVDIYLSREVFIDSLFLTYSLMSSSFIP